MDDQNKIYHPRIKNRIKGAVGFILGIFFHDKTESIKEKYFTIRPKHLTKIDEFIIEGLRWKAMFSKQDEVIDDIHKNFWQHESAISFHAKHSDLFEKIYLKYFQDIVIFLTNHTQKNPANYTQLIEIGTGSGQVLHHLSQNLKTIDRFIGLDLSPEQTARNLIHYKDTPLSFIGTDAYEWILSEGKKNTIFLTHNGVLEYFSNKKLAHLFSQIANHLSPTLFAIIEPIAQDFDLNTVFQSQPFGNEFSFSHNYPHLFEKAGWQIIFIKEVYFESSRILMLVAQKT